MECRQKYEQAVSAITKGKDKKNDSKLLVAPYANWEKFLVPAPLAISLLGELVVISAQTDFTLKEHMPADGYKFLRYPDSFKACLVQITNGGWDAFNEAHTCMDQIRLMSGSVDSHVRESVRLILAGSPEEIEIALPLSLESVDNIATECLQLAKDIENKFGFVMNLTGELLEASTNTQSTYDRKQKRTEQEMGVAKIEKEFAETAVKEQKRRLKNMEKQLQQAQAEYEKAVADVPGGCYMLAMSLTEGVVDTVKNLSSLPVEIVKGLGSGSYNIIGQIVERVREGPIQTEHEKKSLDFLVAEHNVLSRVSLMDPNFESLEQITGIKGIGDMNWNQVNDGTVDAIKASLSRHLQYVRGEIDSGEIGKEASEVCETGIEICNKLLTFEGALADVPSESIQQIQDRCANLRFKSRCLIAKAKKDLGRNPIDERPPCLQQPPASSSGQSVMNTIIDNGRYKVELAKNTLRETRDRQEAADKQMEKSNERMLEALKKMQSLDVEKVDIATVRGALKEGIAVLAQIKAHWGNLVVFFQEISNVIKCCMNISLKKFVNTLESRQKLKAMGQMMSDAFRANMYDQTLQASRTSFVVSEMAGSYVEISTQHLMSQLTILQEMIGISPETHKRQLTLKSEELRKLCQKAQIAIKAKIKKQNDEYKTLIDKRISQIENELGEMLPPSENQKAIEDAVKEGFKSDKNVDETVDDIVG